MTLRIEASAASVFDLIADPARSPDWQTLFVEMGEISGRPGGVGSSFVGFYRVARRRLAGRFIVTAAERPTLFQVNGTTTGGWARWTTMIEPIGAGCRVQVSLEYELPGEIVGSILRILAGHRVEGEFRRTYDNLRRIAEAEAVPVASAAVSAAAGPLGATVATADAWALAPGDDAAEAGGRVATT